MELSSRELEPVGLPPAVARPGVLRNKLFYGLGAVAFGVKDNGFQILLLLYYNRVLGLQASLVGLAILIALVVDGFIDPKIGYWSDRIRSRFGRRHPFMYAAALPASLSYLLLFLPPAHLAKWPLFAYLLVTSVLTRICISFYEIPSSALAPELTSQYDERTSFAGYRDFFGWTGGLSMPLLAFSVFLNYQPGQAIAILDPIGFRKYGIAAAIIMFVSTLVSAFGTQDAVRPVPGQLYYETPKIKIFGELRNIFSNRSALSAIVSSKLMLLATGLSFALGTYFNIYAWGLSPREIAILTSGLFFSAMFALMIAPWVTRKFDKRGATLRAAVILFFVLPFPLELALAGHFPTRESGIMIPFLLFYNMAVTALLVLVPILLSSMLVDVIEELEVQTGLRQEGVIYAINTFIAKFATGLAVFLSAVILTLSHFPDNGQMTEINANVINLMSEYYVGALLVLYAGAIVTTFTYAITRERHSMNLATLAARHMKQAVTAEP